MDNIFMENQKPISFEQYLQYDENSRNNRKKHFRFWSTVCWNIPSKKN